MDVRIEKLVTGAEGFGYINNKPVFVSNALPGELVDVKIIDDKRSYIKAVAENVKETSPLRRNPLCPYYGKCGGCNFQIVDEKTSAYMKEEIVKDNLKRISRLDALPFFDPPAYSNFEGYRSRCRVHVDLRSKEQGFLAPLSNKLIPISNCMALDGKLNVLLGENNGRIYKSARTLLFENRVNRQTGLAEVSLFSGDNDVSDGKRSVDVTVGKYKYSVSSKVFFQSNLRVLPELFEFVRENTYGDTIMDLYSGVGTFSSLFEGSGKRVYAVEKQKECLLLSKKNAPSAISFTSDVFSWAKKVKDPVDTVIVDPPRTGLEKGVAELISSWKPERIIYVSCNPVTLSRDLVEFSDYKIEKARVFDFYPGSEHIESAIVISRND